MASEELKTVNELLEGVDLGGLTLQERRAFRRGAAAEGGQEDLFGGIRFGIHAGSPEAPFNA